MENEEMITVIDPKVVKTIKIGAIVLGAITAAVVVGVVINKTGLLNRDAMDETIEVVSTPE